MTARTDARMVLNAATGDDEGMGTPFRVKAMTEGTTMSDHMTEGIREYLKVKPDVFCTFARPVSRSP